MVVTSQRARGLPRFCPELGVQSKGWRLLVRVVSCRAFPANLRVADRNEAATRGTKHTNSGPVGPPLVFLTRLARLLGLLGFKEDHRDSHGFRSLQTKRLVLPFPGRRSSVPVSRTVRFMARQPDVRENCCGARTSACLRRDSLRRSAGITKVCNVIARKFHRIPILQAGLVECFLAV
jgi:hypothetical protein